MTAEGLARYRLLASALAGCAVDVAQLDGGEPSWTDGRTIHVAGEPGTATLARVVVQAGLIGSGSLDRSVLDRLVGRPRVAQRYLTLEGARVVHALRASAPGLARPLAVVAPDVMPSDTAAASLERALGREPLPDPPDVFGVLRARRCLRAADEEADAGGAPTDADLRADVVQELFPELDEDDESQELGRIAELFSSPLGGRNLLARMLQKLLGMGREPGTGAAGSELPTGALRAGHRPGARARVSLRPLPLPDEAVPAEPGVGVYHEWDATRGRYRPAWCTVREVEPVAAPDRPPAEIRREDRLARRLARLGRELARCRRRPQGDDVDVDALVERYVDLATGAVPRDDVYVENLRTRRDLAVLVLLDVSGSTGEAASAGRGNVYERQREAAAQLLATLHALGDRVAAYGFHSRGRGAVHLVHVKRFDEPLDGAVARRLGAMVPAAYTRLGAAIRHATAVLERQAGTSSRLLVVISDGFVYDVGYEGRYGEEDAARALREARARGVGCLCLSIGASDDDGMRRVFGPSAHARADHLGDLEDTIGALSRQALDLAERRRRLAQRARTIPARHQEAS